MQPLGAIGELEADASCQEEEDEEEEAVWLREQGHCKMRSVQDHLFQGSTISYSSNRRRRGCQGCCGSSGGEPQERLSWHVGGRRGSLGGAKESAGGGSPEGCYTITVRRHGAHMYISL